MREDERGELTSVGRISDHDRIDSENRSIDNLLYDRSSENR